jgi:SRSO17 transposase
MDLRVGSSAERFSSYLEGLVRVIGHADRARPLRDYCVGLMMPCPRKSVEPLAALTAPERTAAQHQSLLHFVGEGGWSDEKVLAQVREMVLPQIERHGAIRAWIIDDTSFPKQGRHSVGVARQYCGQLGKQDNCQVAVSLSLANDHASLPVCWRLYLPQEWAADRQRRKKTGVPPDLCFQTKPEIALDQLRFACEAGLPRGVVLMDAGYGTNTDMRSAVAALGLTYIVGVQPQTTVWAHLSVRKRPSITGSLRNAARQRIGVRELAFNLPPQVWRTITWREGAAERLSSRFARLRVRAAPKDDKRSAVRAEEWLLIEWPKGESEPLKYCLSNLPEDCSLESLVDQAMLRWRIERDYQELKQEVGLADFEGRGWRGFHHHATLCIAAYGFLICERQTIPPSGLRSTAHGAKTILSRGHQLQTATAANRTPRSKLDRNNATAVDGRSRRRSTALSLLRRPNPKEQSTCKFVTQ